MKQSQTRSGLARFCVAMALAVFAALLLAVASDPAIAQNAGIAKTDTSSGFTILKPRRPQTPFGERGASALETCRKRKAWLRHAPYLRAGQDSVPWSCI